MKKIPLFLSLLLLSTGLHAAVQIQIKDVTGQVSSLSSNGKVVRIDSGQMPGYVLIDFRSNQFMMIDTSRKQILHSDLGAGNPGGSAETVSVSLKKGDRGPKIAGYPTRTYSFTANGQSCGTIFASRELMKDAEIRAMFESMRTMQRKSRSMMGGLPGMLDDCQRANFQLADALESRGAPMRVVDAGGQLQSEVVAVKKNVSLGGGFFEAPSGMARVDLDKQVSDAKQQAGELMKNLPDMNQLMEQMQQQGGGEMTPEMQQQMQQQMQKLMEQLKQLQPQE